MSSTMKIRFATEADCESILEIYAPYIMNTVITFEYQVPSIEKFRERIHTIQKNHPWLVCEIDRTIVGYAYASPFGEREAYQWSADLSVYLRPEYRRKNIGKALYWALMELLKLQGYRNVYGVVTQHNRGSELFHESLGFQSVGIFHDVGFKFDKWLSVQWYEFYLQEHTPSPVSPQPVQAIDITQRDTILKKAVQMISPETSLD